MANEYEKALAHAKAGRLEAAQSILLSLEDERSERLLQKVNAAMAARNTGNTSKAVAEGMKQAEQAKAQASGKALGQGCLAVLVILFLCWAIMAATMPTQPDSSIKTVCEWQEMVAPSTSCTPERILRDYRPMVDACYALWSSANTYNIVEWSNCLENKSVDLID